MDFALKVKKRNERGFMQPKQWSTSKHRLVWGSTWSMWLTSKMEQCSLVCMCEAMWLSLYWTGILQPANSTIFPPCSLWKSNRGVFFSTSWENEQVVYGKLGTRVIWVTHFIHTCEWIWIFIGTSGATGPKEHLVKFIWWHHYFACLLETL